MENKITYEITIDSQLMVVYYEPDSMAGYVGHFEFRSPHNPPKRIPVSETGYRSEFIFMDALKNITDMEACIYDIAHAIINEKSANSITIEDNDEQIALF